MDVLVALQPDVVIEPLRLLVGVGVAADIRQQRRVVDDRPLFLIETQVLGEAKRDLALAQDVLHRLAEPEIDAQRQRSDELGQANPIDVRLFLHSGIDASVPGRRVTRRRRTGTGPCPACTPQRTATEFRRQRL